jgi:hypothetical protein
MTFPTKRGPTEIPPSVEMLIVLLLPRLLEGSHPALAALREQFRGVRITEVEMTGHGFYAHFAVPQDAPLANPPDFAGGNADIVLSSTQNGAGCVVFVRKGRLATLEGYTFTETWELDAQVTEIKSVTPIVPE